MLLCKSSEASCHLPACNRFVPRLLHAAVFFGAYAMAFVHASSASW